MRLDDRPHRSVAGGHVVDRQLQEVVAGLLHVRV
jgi:hypothetical protein